MTNPSSAHPELGPRLAAGRTAEIFAWGEHQVLKLYQAWVPGSDADHEAAMTAAVCALGLPVPPSFGRVDVDGRPGLLFERVVGASLLESMLHEPTRALDAAQTLARLQAAMHALSAPVLPRLHARLADRIQRATLLPPLWQEAAIGLLHALPDGDALCHGDFHPGNVLLAAAGPIIIDWVDATSGHPLADVARTVVLMRYGQAPDEPEARAVTSSFRAAFIEAYLAAYRALRPASDEDLQQWLPVVMAARLAEGALKEQATLLNVLAPAFGPPAA